MLKSKQEILDSGILELYILGELNSDEEKELTLAIEKYPSLKVEIRQIEKSLEALAQKAAVEPHPNVLNSILSSLPEKQSSKEPTKDKSFFNWSYLLLAIGLISSIAYAFWQKSKYQELQNSYDILKEECDVLQNDYNSQLALYEDAHNYDNQIIRIAASDNFKESKIIFYTNPETKKNYLEIADLPNLGSNETFQLWSLKADSDPIPLNLFGSTLNKILEVDFVDGSSAYAITIEKSGGAQAPNLDKLIGVFNI